MPAIFVPFARAEGLAPALLATIDMHKNRWSPREQKRSTSGIMHSAKECLRVRSMHR